VRDRLDRVLDLIRANARETQDIDRFLDETGRRPGVTLDRSLRLERGAALVRRGELNRSWDVLDALVATLQDVRYAGGSVSSGRLEH